MSHRPIHPAVLSAIAARPCRKAQNECYVWVCGRGERGELVQVTPGVFCRYVRRYPGATYRRETFIDRSNGRHEIRIDDSRLPAVVVRAVGRNGSSHAAGGC